MVPRTASSNPARRIAAAVLLLGLAHGLVWLAWAVSTPYRDAASLGRRLPDLPPVRSATLPSKGGFPVTVWAHRVNSVQRAVLLAKDHRGLEIDVVYDAVADYFDVGHPPVPSAGISLERLLAALPDVRHRYFWIDFKNLTADNARAACDRLRSIAGKFGIVGNMIVESTEPAALQCFTEHGFYTSYYLFPERGAETMSAAELTEYYREVTGHLARSRVNALSSSYRSLQFMEKYFPDADHLVWYLERGKGVRYHAALHYLKRRPGVKVILVRVPSADYR